MKTLIFLAFTLGLSALIEPNYKDNLEITDNNVKVVFNDKLNFNDMVAIKLELEQNNIHIAYNNMKFDAFGKLQDIDYEITSLNSGKSIDAEDLAPENSIKIEKL